MKKNIGSIDRLTRLLASIAVAIPFVTGLVSREVGIILLAISLILFLTSTTGFCPLYSIFGLNTSSKINRTEL